MAITETALNSIFLGLLYGSALMVFAIVAFFLWRMVKYKHRVVLHEVTENNKVGRSFTYKVCETKDRAGAILWKRGGPQGKTFPQPPPGFYSVMGRGKFAQGYLYEDTVVWVKPELRKAEHDDNWVQKLDLFDGSQKHSYLAIEEQAMRKKLNNWDRLFQVINVGVLALVLLVIVFGWSELTQAPKDMVDKMAPIAKSLERASENFADANEKIAQINDGVQELRGRPELPAEAPQ